MSASELEQNRASARRAAAGKRETAGCAYWRAELS